MTDNPALELIRSMSSDASDLSLAVGGGGPQGSFYLGLATATALFCTAAYALGLLRPGGRGARLASIGVVLSAVLGIVAAFVVVARERPTGALHVVVGLGLVVPGAYVLIRAIDSIVDDRRETDADLDGIRLSPSLPAAPLPSPSARHVRRVAVATATVLVPVVALLAASVPELPEAVLDPGSGKPSAQVGYAPANRPVFECLTPHACPGPGYATFNSYKNAPNYGDERAFIDAKPASIDSPGHYRDVLEVDAGQLVVIRAYFNNSGDARFETEPGRSVAHSTRLHMLLPRGSRSTQAIAGSLSADDAIPHVVSDGVTLWADMPFEVRYVPGSARLFNSVWRRGLPMPDELVSDGSLATKGAMLGFRRMDGRVAGRFEESGLVTFLVQIL